MPTTALDKIANLYFKREDQNTTGSAKDRAVSLQVKSALDQKYTSAVISSSGNAAISALHFCRLAHINLTIFLSPKTDPKKIAYLRALQAQIIFSPKPISFAFRQAKRNHSYNLRQSLDPKALEGYRQIGLEIVHQLPQVSSIFIPVGSGTTLLGLSAALPPQTKIFAVQPANRCPVASYFDQDFTPENTTLTTSLSIRSLPLKNKIIAAIKKSHGSALVVQNQDVLDNLPFLSQNQINASAETALAVAGFRKAQKQNMDFGQYPLILVTGINRPKVPK